MVYSGKTAAPGAVPNLRKTPLTIRGPLIEQIDDAVRAVLRELDEGLTLASSGFKTRHVYPERVVKEAIVNAVIHRDYWYRCPIESNEIWPIPSLPRMGWSRGVCYLSSKITTAQKPFNCFKSTT